MGTQLPAIVNKETSGSDFSNEREILYKVLFDMKSDLNDLKKLTLELMENDNHKDVQEKNEHLIQKIYKDQNLSNSKHESQILSLSESNQKNETIEIVKPNENYHFIIYLDFNPCLLKINSLSINSTTSNNSNDRCFVKFWKFKR